MSADQIATRDVIVEIAPRLRVDNARWGFFEREESARVVAGLPRPVDGVARLAYRTGRREQESLGLTWVKVDCQHCVIRPPDSTRGEG